MCINNLGWTIINYIQRINIITAGGAVQFGSVCLPWTKSWVWPPAPRKPGIERKEGDQKFKIIFKSSKLGWATRDYLNKANKTKEKVIKSW